MERKLQERMVGAAVLLLVLVIVAPMVLDGGADNKTEPDVPGQRGDEQRTQVFQLDTPATGRPTPADTTATLEPLTTQGAVVPEREPGQPAAPAAPARMAPTPPPAPEKMSAAPSVSPAPAPASPQPVGSAGEATGGGWLVQVGTFGQRGNADRLSASLRASGFAAEVSPMERAGRTLYRVRVGPAGSREAATRLAGRLAAAGQSGQIVAK